MKIMTAILKNFLYLELLYLLFLIQAFMSKAFDKIFCFYNKFFGFIYKDLFWYYMLFIWSNSKI